jgi:hypothetical protein
LENKAQVGMLRKLARIGRKKCRNWEVEAVEGKNKSKISNTTKTVC